MSTHTSSPAAVRAAFAALALTLLAGGCERETRYVSSAAPPPPTQFVAQVPLRPGPDVPADTSRGPYDASAYATSEGQLLFEQMNCSGCHANGGGGMGPPLMDSEWTYGSRPDQVFASIAEGRPNGMPSWQSRLNDKQIWELVAYVRSLSGLTPKGARPSREDHMTVKAAPFQTPSAAPVQSGLPPSSQQP